MITIVEWIGGIVLAYYFLRISLGICMGLFEFTCEAIMTRKRNKRARHAFENDTDYEYKPEFKFRYLLPRKK